jgi:hypothetical protein
MIMNQYSAGDLLTGEDAVVRLVDLLGQGDARRVLHYQSLWVPSRLWRLMLKISREQQDGQLGHATDLVR